MKMLMLMLIMMSINFMFMKHPLSMGFILLMETILSSLTCSLNLSSYFMSDILFLIFIGGMLILFKYMSSIASNENFFFSMKLLMVNMLFIFLLLTNNINIDFDMSLMKLINLHNEYNYYFINKLYMLPSGNITLLTIIYLLFTLIIVSLTYCYSNKCLVIVIKMKSSPLRSN